jgi:hypothetical protein
MGNTVTKTTDSRNKLSKAAAEKFLVGKSVDKVPNCLPYSKWNQAAKERLRVIMDSDVVPPQPVQDKEDCELVNEITFKSEFNLFCEKCPEWTDDDAIRFWDNYPDVTDLLVLRRQKSGLCFMHAAVMLQHYLVCICREKAGKTASGTEIGNEEVGVIDMAWYIKTYWRGDKLAHYLLGDCGGCSFDFFEEINHHIGSENLNVRREYLTNATAATWDRLLGELRHRPVLVSSFTVRRSLFFSEDVKFDCSDEGKLESLGMHAMVMIGGRKKNGKYYFLLQNWWSNRYFIEVSESYLQFAAASVTFVHGDIACIPREFCTVRTAYAETSVDCAERIDELCPSQ